MHNNHFLDNYLQFNSNFMNTFFEHRFHMKTSSQWGIKEEIFQAKNLSGEDVFVINPLF